MEYKKWEVYNGHDNYFKDSPYILMQRDNHIPPMDVCQMIFHKSYTQANAALIIEAVNACIEINPQNPLAVAKEIGEMYRIIQYLSRIGWNSGVSWDATDIIYRIQSKEQEA